MISAPLPFVAVRTGLCGQCLLEISASHLALAFLQGAVRSGRKAEWSTKLQGLPANAFRVAYPKVFSWMLSADAHMPSFLQVAVRCDRGVDPNGLQIDHPFAFGTFA